MATVTTLRPEHIPALYRLYRVQTDSLPHCLAPGEARFRADLERFGAAGLLVAEEGGAAVGFAALAHVKDDHDTECDAVTALFFESEPDGHALLAACEA